jgi:hypothetical protein
LSESKDFKTGDPIKIYTIDEKSSPFDETLGANTLEQLEVLRTEYFKKITIELIETNQSNLCRYNIVNLYTILGQLSSAKSSPDLDDKK